MEYIIKVEERTASGKSANKKMRRQGVIPGVIYGHGEKAVNLSINEKELKKLLDEIKGHSPIVSLQIGEQPAVKAVIKTMQRAAVTKKLLSIDFQLVHAKEKITMNVPVILKGSPIGVKEGGILDHPLRSIPVRCEIDKVPEHIEIDITHLNIGHSVHLSDLKFEGVEYMLTLDTPIVSVLSPRKVVEVAAAPVTEGITEPEVITEKKKEEATEVEAETGGRKKATATAETKKETKK